MIIAVIDDDQLFHFVTKRQIRKVLQDSPLLQFQNGQDAFDYLITHQQERDTLPDLIFVDINMPIMNGWEFLDHFRELLIQHYHPLIYLVSSSVDNQDEEMAKYYPELKSYLTKPLTQEQIRDILTDSVRHYQG